MTTDRGAPVTTTTHTIWGLRTVSGHVVTWPDKQSAQARAERARAEGYDPELVSQNVTTTRTPWTAAKAETEARGG